MPESVQYSEGRLITADTGVDIPDSAITPSGTYALATATWRANTAYKAGALVVNAGLLYSAKVDFTSGVSFNAANWDAVLPAVLTTKGDLLTFDTAAKRLPVGTNGNALLADSSQAAGLRWAPVGTIVASNENDVPALNTVVETALATLSTPSGLAAGDRLVFRATGDMLNNTGGNVNYTWAIKIGATTALVTAATAIAAGANRRKWYLEALIVLPTVSSQRVTGTLQVSSQATANWVAAAGTNNTFANGYGTAAEDMSASKDIVFTVTLGTASANADMVCHTASLERLTAGNPAPSLAISAGLVDAKGDLITGTANDTVGRLAVGLDGTVLVADSTAAGGLSWSPGASGTNKFDPSGASTNTRINTATGGTSVVANETTTRLIPIQGDTIYNWDVGGRRMAFYDTAGVFISGLTANRTFKTPSTARYYRATVTAATINTAQIEEGVTFSPAVEAYETRARIALLRLTESQATERLFDSGVLKSKYSMTPRSLPTVKVGRNLLDQRRVISGYGLFSGATGMLASGSNGVIPVDAESGLIAGATYSFCKRVGTNIVTGSVAIYELDVNGNVIVENASVSTFTANAATTTLLVSISLTDLANVMLVPGSTIPARYVSYDQAYLPTYITAGQRLFEGKTFNALTDSLGDLDFCWNNTSEFADELGLISHPFTDNNPDSIAGSSIEIRPDFESDPLEGPAAGVLRYDDINASADVFLMTQFTNGWSTPGGITSGLISDYPRNPRTTYGAMHLILEGGIGSDSVDYGVGVLERWANKPIFILGSPPRRNMFNYVSGTSGPTTGLALNDIGITLLQYQDIIADVCAYHGVPFMHMLRRGTQLCPQSLTNFTANYTDQTHLSAAGQQIWAREIAAWIKTIRMPTRVWS